MNKKPITILSTDWHIDKNNIESKKQIIAQKISLANELNIKHVFCMGDVFQDRKAQPLINLKGFVEIIDMFNKARIYLHCIPGNHDKVDYESDDSYLDIFKNYSEYFILYNDYIVLSNTISTIDIILLPYYKENTIYLKKLNEINNIRKTNNEPNILLTHCSINNVNNNDCIRIENELKEELFDKFDKVFIGHFHNKSNISKKIHYIGSINPKDFSEDNEKGFTILYDDLSFELFKPISKEFHIIDIDLDKVDKKELNKLIKQYSNHKDDIRFQFIGDSGELKLLDDNFYSSLGIDVKKKRKDISESILLASQNEFISYNKSNILDKFDKYCCDGGLDNVDYGRAKLLEILTSN